MGEFIHRPWRDQSSPSFELAECACGKPAEDDDPRCADCITAAEIDGMDGAAERWWSLSGCAA